MSTTNTLFNLSDIKNSNDKILNSIDSLGNLSTSLASDMAILQSTSSSGLTGPTLSVYNDLRGKLTDIDGIRTNLHSQIDQVNAFYENGLVSMKTIQEQQKKATDIMNSQTSINNGRLESIKTEQNNKMRLVEINSYYSKKYEAQSEIMKIIIIVSVITLILWILDTKQVLPIPSFVTTILISLSITIGAVVIFYKCYYLILRNNVDYDQIDFDIPSNKLPIIDTSPTRKIHGGTGPASSNAGQCINDECCPPGFAYNTELNFCTVGM